MEFRDLLPIFCSVVVFCVHALFHYAIEKGPLVVIVVGSSSSSSNSSSSSSSSSSSCSSSIDMMAWVLVMEWTDNCIQWNRKPLRNKHDMVKST